MSDLYVQRQGCWLFSYLPPSSRSHWAAQTSSVPVCVHAHVPFEYVYGCVRFLSSCERLCIWGLCFGTCSSLAVPQEGSVGLWAFSPPSLPPRITIWSFSQTSSSHLVSSPSSAPCTPLLLYPWWHLSWERSSRRTRGETPKEFQAFGLQIKFITISGWMSTWRLKTNVVQEIKGETGRREIKQGSGTELKLKWKQVI